MSQQMVIYVIKNQFTFIISCLPFKYMFNLENAEDEEIIRHLTLFPGYATNYFLDELAASKRTINVIGE